MLIILCRQSILFGLYIVVWAECSLLLRVFTYKDVLKMSFAPLLYVCMSPILLVCVMLCFFCPMRVVTFRDFVLVRIKGREENNPERNPLLPS
jgi:hypothetical protein